MNRSKTRGSTNMDLNVAKEAQKPFYQPMQLQDIDNMVEISSASSNESVGRV